MQVAKSPIEIARIMKSEFNPDAEELWALCLNARGVLIAKKMIFRGTVDMCPSHPRDIFRYVILQNSSAFILVHNHPSGDSNPSDADLALTNRILRISKMLEIQFLDHIILGIEQFSSLQQLGYFSSIRVRPRKGSACLS